MKDTKNYMQTLIGDMYDGVETNELVNSYMRTGEELILGCLFVRNYALLKSISNKFVYLTNHECASVCLLEIETVCVDYDESRNTKFSTVLYRYVYNELRAQNNMKTYNKRKINTDNTIKEDIDVLVELNKEPGMFDYYELELKSFLDSVKLTKNERRYCEIVASENSGITDTDIGHQLNITPQAIYSIKNRLKSKFGNMGGILIA